MWRRSSWVRRRRTATLETRPASGCGRPARAGSPVGGADSGDFGARDRFRATLALRTRPRFDSMFAAESRPGAAHPARPARQGEQRGPEHDAGAPRDLDGQRRVRPTGTRGRSGPRARDRPSGPHGAGGGAARRRLRPRRQLLAEGLHPLTKLCRDVCHYCTFAQPAAAGRTCLHDPRRGSRSGATRGGGGCREALFTLGDKPELRYPRARAELDALGYPTTIAYLVAAARAVFAATGLLPHANPGVCARDELLALRAVCPSQGMMLESVSRRLLDPGQAHHGSPDKDPDARLETIRPGG